MADAPREPTPVTRIPAEEAALTGALERLRAGDPGGALALVEPLVRRNPEFRLAQLVYADALSAAHRPILRMGDSPAAGPARLQALREEARLRYRQSRGPVPGNVPADVLVVSPSQPEVLVVDLAASRLYQLERTGAGAGVALRRHVYVSIGKNGARKQREGDQRTPVGVYFITGRIDPQALSDFYGTGALPIDYPNEWDRRQGRTGYGIWIHGVPSETYARAPRASDGCMVVANADLDALWSSIDGSATPVVIADGLRWAPADQVRRRSAALLRAIERWRRDWESLDPDRYARHYAGRFRSEYGERERWLSRKRRINARKRWVRIGIDDLSAFAYPGTPNMVVVTFDQRYDSDNYAGDSRKRQYWVEEGDGTWRILYEGEVRLRPEHLRGIPYSARTGMARLDTR